MKASGNHILVYLPNPKTQTDGGVVVLPGQEDQLYGRVVSVGGQVLDDDIEEGDIVVWKRMGEHPVEYGGLNDEEKLVAVMDDTIIFHTDDDWLKARKLPVPPALDEIDLGR